MLDSNAKIWNAMRELYGLLRGLAGPSLAISLEVRSVLHTIKQQELLEILEWVSKVPYKKHHDETAKFRVKETCEWLVSDTRFTKWEGSKSSVIL